jgi:hypothetical protein
MGRKVIPQTINNGRTNLVGVTAGIKFLKILRSKIWNNFQKKENPF